MNGWNPWADITNTDPDMENFNAQVKNFLINTGGLLMIKNEAELQTALSGASGRNLKQMIFGTVYGATYDTVIKGFSGGAPVFADNLKGQLSTEDPEVVACQAFIETIHNLLGSAA